MKAQILKWAQKVDALSLRERAILFVVTLVCLVALTDAAWITPAVKRFQVQQQQFATQSAEIQRLRTELQAAGKPVDQNQGMRDALAAVSAEIAAVNADIDQQLAGAGSGRSLEPVLVQFLRRQGKLTLVATQTLKGDPAGAANVAVPGLTRQGLELRITGTYPELVRYVQAVESALPHLRWGNVQISAEKQPPELTMQVFVLGVTP